jgi:hypothetical protein
MNDDEHVHIHIDPGALRPGTHYHIHLGTTVIEPDLPGHACDVETDNDPAAEMAAVINGYGDASTLQAIYDELIDAGFSGMPSTPREPGRKPLRYLSWFDPARERSNKTVIRYNAHNIWFLREEDLSLLGGLNLPGAELNMDDRSHNMHFLINKENLPYILAAVRRVKR